MSAKIRVIEIITQGPQGPAWPSAGVQSASESARDAAQAYEAAANASAVVAQQAETNASASATVAETKANEASASAASAGASEASAILSASLASTKANEASNSAQSASASESSAQASATAASVSESNAAASSTNAAILEAQASVHANSAQSSEIAAVAASAAALESSNSASISASNALASETSAASSAATATEKAVIATEQAANSQTHAANANASANAAALAESNALASQAEAANSASAALSSQVSAAQSETSSNSSQLAAATSEINASNSATAASTSAATASSQAQAAATHATNASNSAEIAGVKASEARGFAAQALAIYGSSTAQQNAVNSADAASRLAARYAASAASVSQQDVSGFINKALHRSTRDINDLFVYDTSLDSDGGAWTDQCKNSSWYNEPLSGEWFGPLRDFKYAYYKNATLGQELILNGGFDDATSWNTGGSWVIENGVATKPSGGSSSILSQNISITAGKTYEIKIDVTSIGASSDLTVLFQGGTTAQALNAIAEESGTQYFYITAKAGNYSFQISVLNTGYATIDNVSVKEILKLNHKTGNYFQLFTDGKFYKTIENLSPTSDDLRSWSYELVTRAGERPDPFGGTAASKLIENAVTPALYGFRVWYGAAFYVFGLPVTVSLYAKPAGRRNLYLRFGRGGSYAHFDLENGVVLTNAVGTTASIVPAPNGFYRVTLTCNPDGLEGQTHYAELRILDDNQSYIYQGDGVSGIDVYGFQLEISDSVSEYKPNLGTDGAKEQVFRGNKKEFPKLAAIVLEERGAAIYDLTEKNTPMWMELISAGGNSSVEPQFGQKLRYGIKTKVKAYNGRILIGGGGSAPTNGGGLQHWEFTKDRMYVRTHQYGGTVGIAPGKISDRIFGDAIYAPLGAVPFNHFVSLSSVVNDVDMKVIDSSQIDEVDGLPIPTIVVATGAGVEVIKSDGTVFTVPSSSSALGVTITANNDIVAALSSSWVYTFRYPWTQNEIGWNTFQGRYGDRYRSGDLRFIQMSYPNKTFSAKQYDLIFKEHIYLIRRNPSIESLGLIANIARNANTLWQIGNHARSIGAPYKPGTDADNHITGDNANFVNGIGDWSPYSSATLSHDAVNQRMYVQSSSLYHGAILEIPIAIANGGAYKVTVDFELDTAPFIGVRLSGPSGYDNDTSTSNITVSPYEVTVTPIESNYLYVHGAGNFYINSVKVEAFAPNRNWQWSIGGRPRVYGALARTQVEPGATLCSYSGFSQSNYLREGYSSETHFGASPFYLSAWYRLPSGSLPAMPVKNTELLSNGDLSDGTNFWSVHASGTVSGGVAAFVDSPNSANLLQQNTISTRLGKTYELSFTLTNFVSGGLMIYLHNISTTLSSTSGDGTYNIRLTARDVTGAGFLIRANGTTTTVSISNMSLKEVSDMTLVERSDGAGNAYKLAISEGRGLIFSAEDGTNVAHAGFYSNLYTLNDGRWHKIEGLYFGNGVTEIRYDGQTISTYEGASVSLSDASQTALLTIGNNFELDGAFQGEIVTVNIAPALPSEEQSKFMFETEYQLFQENALCLGNSTADFALDPKSGEYVVSGFTSAADQTHKRMIFNGLRMIDLQKVKRGTFNAIAYGSNVLLEGRNISTSEKGWVDVSMPSYSLRKELLASNPSADISRTATTVFDYAGGFTAGAISSGSYKATSVSGLVYPTSFKSAFVSASGYLATDTKIVTAISTTVYFDKTTLTSGSNVTVSFRDFYLPSGFDPVAVYVSGVNKQHGVSKDWIEKSDGFRKYVRLNTAPAHDAWIQIHAKRTLQ